MADHVESCGSCGYAVHPDADKLLEQVEFMLQHGKSPQQVAGTIDALYGDHWAPAKALELTVKPIEGAALICFSEPVTHQQADAIKQIAQVWPHLKPVVAGCVDGVIPAEALVQTLATYKRQRGGAPLGLS